jgi:FkbM family methyltransferase
VIAKSFLIPRRTEPTDLGRRVRRRLRLSYRVRVNFDGGCFEYRTDRHDALYLRTFDENLGGWERLPRDIFSKIARVSRTVLDIGSYSGIYALIALAASNECVVHAFEPLPANFARVKRNLRLNHKSATQRYLLHQIALSNLTTDRMIHIGLEPQLSTASLERDFNEVVVRQLKIAAVRLDDFHLQDVDLIKIDVEGHECQVLEGARELLTRDTPVVLFESLAAEQFRLCKAELGNAGYLQIAEIDSRKRIFAAVPPPRHTNDALRKSLFEFFDSENLRVQSIVEK